MWRKLRAWWRQFRRPRCEWCGIPIEKGQCTCESPECIELHKTSQMAP
jgi:hypothetical protein